MCLISFCFMPVENPSQSDVEFERYEFVSLHSLNNRASMLGARLDRLHTWTFLSLFPSSSSVETYIFGKKVLVTLEGMKEFKQLVSKLPLHTQPTRPSRECHFGRLCFVGLCWRVFTTSGWPRTHQKTPRDMWTRTRDATHSHQKGASNKGMQSWVHKR